MDVETLWVHHDALGQLVDALARRLEPVPIPTSSSSSSSSSSALGHGGSRGLQTTQGERGRRQQRRLQEDGTPTEHMYYLPGAHASDWAIVATLAGGARLETASAARLLATLAESLPQWAPRMDGMGLVQVSQAFANASPSVPPPPSSARRPRLARSVQEAADRWAVSAAGKVLASDAAAERQFLRRSHALRPFRARVALDHVAAEWLARGTSEFQAKHWFTVLAPFLRAEHCHAGLTEAAVAWAQETLLPLTVARSEQDRRDGFKQQLGAIPTVPPTTKIAMRDLARLHGMLQRLGVRRLRQRWQRPAGET